MSGETATGGRAIPLETESRARPGSRFTPVLLRGDSPPVNGPVSKVRIGMPLIAVGSAFALGGAVVLLAATAAPWEPVTSIALTALAVLVASVQAIRRSTHG